MNRSLVKESKKYAPIDNSLSFGIYGFYETAS